MSYFDYNTCIWCTREWSETSDTREEKRWWKLRSQQGQRWLCNKCVNNCWRRAAKGANIDAPPDVKEKLQTQEFQDDLRNMLDKHLETYPTRQKVVEKMEVD